MAPRGASPGVTTMAVETAPLNPRVPFVFLIGLAAVYVVLGYIGSMAWTNAFLLANVFAAAAIVYAGMVRFLEEHVVAPGAAAAVPVVPAGVPEDPVVDEVPVDVVDAAGTPDLVVMTSKDDRKE